MEFNSLNIIFLFLRKSIVKSNRPSKLILSNFQTLERKRTKTKLKTFLSSFFPLDVYQLSFHLQSRCKLTPLPPRVFHHPKSFLTFMAFLITKENSPKEDVWWGLRETQTPTFNLIWNLSTFSCCGAAHFIHSSPWADSSQFQWENEQEAPERAKNNTLFP